MAIAQRPRCSAACTFSSGAVSYTHLILSDRGHLSNENAGRALARLYTGGLKQAVLGHLSRDNNFAELALATIREQLRQADIPDADLPLTVALREEVTGRFYTGG